MANTKNNTTEFIDGNQVLKDINTVLSKVVEVMRTYESKLVKTERIQLESFAYVINYVDNKQKSIYSYIAANTNQSYVTKIKSLENRVNELNNQVNNLIEENKKHKFRLFGFIFNFIDKIKERKEKKRLEQERLLKEEQERIEREKQEQLAKEERDKNRAKNQQKISSIIQSMPKPKF